MARFHQFTEASGQPFQVRLSAIIAWKPASAMHYDNIQSEITICNSTRNTILVQEDYNFISCIMKESNG